MLFKVNKASKIGLILVFYSSYAMASFLDLQTGTLLGPGTTDHLGQELTSLTKNTFFIGLFQVFIYQASSAIEILLHQPYYHCYISTIITATSALLSLLHQHCYHCYISTVIIATSAL